MPPKKTRVWPSCVSPVLYRARNAIKRMFCRLMDFRRIAARCHKLATNVMTAVYLAATVSDWSAIRTRDADTSPFRVRIKITAKSLLTFVRSEPGPPSTLLPNRSYGVRLFTVDQSMADDPPIVLDLLRSKVDLSRL